MRFLSNKEKKELSGKLPKGCSFSKKEEIKEEGNLIYKGKDKFLIILDGEYLPHLSCLDENDYDDYKSVYVDKGAIPFIIKGADLMRPGIQKIDEEIENGDIVLVRDENHNKIIAIGRSLFSSDDMKIQKKGKSIDIYHYVGDEYY
ncbi:MAG: DUF1947 domain-containing protein [Nanoarchaeota archaeon]|nr:DUF1947 domain-containing protein [Nanoarchaeota archaeon]